jgi:hypothetical protein
MAITLGKRTGISLDMRADTDEDTFEPFSGDAK